MGFGDLVVFLLAVYGLTFVILAKHSFLRPLKEQLEKVQPFRSMFKCFFCTSFWPSLALTLCMLFMTEPGSSELDTSTLLMLPFAGATFAYSLHRILPKE